MTDDEREEVLQLLANYENMARGVASLVHLLRTDPAMDLQQDRYRSVFQDVSDLAPVWRNYASLVRQRLMLERRNTIRPNPSPDRHHGNLPDLGWRPLSRPPGEGAD